MFKKIICICGAFIVLVGLSDIGYVLVMGSIRLVCPPADDVIVLGSGHGNSAVKRALTGLAIYDKDKSQTLVLSGGKTDFPTSEAEFMESVIVSAAHVPTSTIPFILEENSRSTYENFLDSRQLIPKARSITIVTDTFHIGRSVLIARSLGFHNICWASPDPSYLDPTTLAQYYVREMAAVPVYVEQLLASYL